MTVTGRQLATLAVRFGKWGREISLEPHPDQGAHRDVVVARTDDAVLWVWADGESYTEPLR